MKMIVRRESGFTLVELLMVMVIIAVLAAISIPQITKYKRRAYVTDINASAKNIYTSAQNYLADFPTGTVDSVTKLRAGGYNDSLDISYKVMNMTVSGGKVNAYSTTLNALGFDNEAVVRHNGSIDLVDIQ